MNNDSNNNDLFGCDFRNDLYDKIAYILTYPNEDFYNISSNIKILLEKSNYDSKDLFDNFYSQIKEKSIGDIQELYTATFELNAKFSLNIGSHIFKDDIKKRSMFMSRIREALIKYSVEEKTELPDFLPFILRLATKIDEVNSLESLLVECLIDPISEMIKQFEDSKNPYNNLLKTVLKILQYDFKKIKTVELEDSLC